MVKIVHDESSEPQKNSSKFFLGGQKFNGLWICFVNDYNLAIIRTVYVYDVIWQVWVDHVGTQIGS